MVDSHLDVGDSVLEDEISDEDVTKPMDVELYVPVSTYSDVSDVEDTESFCKLFCRKKVMVGCVRRL